jgi:hypothetical protein
MAESLQQGLKLQVAVQNDWGHGPPHLLSWLVRTLLAQWLPLGMHPRCKFGTLLKLRTVNRGVLFASPGMFKRLMHWLRAHPNADVRVHVSIMLARGRTFWLGCCRTTSEDLLGNSGGGTAELQEAPDVCNVCCDPIRQIVEAELLPCLSHVLTRDGKLRWLRLARIEKYMCIDCGRIYKHLWRETMPLVIRLLRSLRVYLMRVYTRAEVHRRDGAV